MAFWWEDGFDASKVKADEEAGKVLREGRAATFDGKGRTFRVHNLVKTGFHHLDGHFFNQNGAKFMMLNNEGRQKFTISIFEVRATTTPPGFETVEIKTMETEKNSGFLSISNDDSMVAVGILKEDSISIVEIESEDLLINMSGGRKTGYWGNLQFPAPKKESKSNNLFVELRVLKMQKSNPVDSVLRVWDLGFADAEKEHDRNREEDEDEDEDEEERIVWQYNLSGKCHYVVCSNFIIVTCEEEKTIEWLDKATGRLLNMMNVGQWLSKPVLSASGVLFAVAHIGSCTVRTCATGEVIATLRSPEEKDIYPVVPVRFMDNDTLLAARIDLSMTFLLSSISSPSSSVAISDFGRTISNESVAISPDERFLACWPFGNIEMYDMNAVKQLLYKKISKQNVLQVLKMAALVKQKRAELVVSSGISKFMDRLLNIDEQLFYFILRFLL